MKQSKKVAIISMGVIMLTAAGIWAASAVRAQTADTNAGESVAAPAVGHSSQKRLDQMAALLGLSTTQLQTELDSGKEFYQVAAEHGVTYDKLQASQTAQYQARLADMVKVGFLTQAQADTMLKSYQDKLAASPMMGLGPDDIFGGHGPGPR